MGRPRRIAPRTDGFRALVERYRLYRTAHGYAVRSARHEGYQAGEFLAWLEGRGTVDIAAVTPEHVAAYAGHVATRPKHDDGSGSITGALSAGAAARHWAAVRGVLAMLHHAGELDTDPASGLSVSFAWERGTASGREPLTQGEVGALYAACETQTERAVLALGYGCGLRLAEAAALDVGAVRFGGGPSGCGAVVVERGKRARRRIVPLAAGVRDDLADYYRGERAEREARSMGAAGRGVLQAALVLNANGQRMRTWTYPRVLGQVVARAVAEGRLAADVAQAKRVTFHGLRHAVATHLLERGLTLEQVGAFLGHAAPESTETYVHVSAGLLEQLVPP